jgi:hypothetical protein
MIVRTGMLALCLLASRTDAAPAKKLPQFSNVEQYVLRYFSAKPTYRQGDLLTRTDAQAVIKAIQATGWRIADARTILTQIPSDQDFIARQLYTAKGEKFMRKISAYPLAYDRLDHLSRLPDGRKTVLELIRGKDGHKMIEYMTQSAGGKNLGKMLGQAAQGVDFNQPTGRIYTVKAFIERLRTSYQQTVEQQEVARL